MFEIDVEYDRQELLDFAGSKQAQSGIIWGNNEPGCIIVTSGGRHGNKVGYGNTRNPNGTWDYVGQGSSGNQKESSFANAILINEKRDVLLFTTREPSIKEQRERGNWRKRYKFEGIFNVPSYRFTTPQEGKRANDRLLVFHLIPAANIYENEGNPVNLKIETNLLKLRQEILDSNPGNNKNKQPSLADYKARSKKTKVYALTRANGNGICELCEIKAPFIAQGDYPFLEVHHIYRLADDGPDLPINVSAICPNCHREAHFGIRRYEIRDKLANIVNRLELEISRIIDL